VALVRLAVAAFVGGVVASGSAVAHAHSGGVNAGGCGCHGNGDVGLSVDISPMMFDPGDEITVTVTVAQPGGQVAGVFIDDDGDVGTLNTLGGQGLAEVQTGLTHTSPKSMGGGSAQWSFNWTAPNVPGAVRFFVWGVAGNDNGSSSGDDVGAAPFDFTFGCTGQEYYWDGDGDGYGRTNVPLVHCEGAAPSGYAVEPGDCNDNDADQHPGAVEYCNQIDDDCDGTVDEEALPLELYPDADGDGYYSQAEFESGETLLGCIPAEGWAAEPGDCRPEDPAVNPGVEETCNGFDDNCDSDIDEFVRPRCGEGWCVREAVGCDSENCTPGEPREEVCNFFDDDCDGIVDNDVACPPGEVCQAGQCRAEAEPDETGGDGTTSAMSPMGSTGAMPSGASQDGAGCGCRGGNGPDGWWGLGVLLGLLGLRSRRRTVTPRVAS